MASNRVLSIQYVLGIVRGVFGVLIIKQILSRVRRFDCFVFLFFSSPEHEVLMVSYCDQSMSVVRRASCVVRRQQFVLKANSS